MYTMSLREWKRILGEYSHLLVNEGSREYKIRVYIQVEELNRLITEFKFKRFMKKFMATPVRLKSIYEDLIEFLARKGIEYEVEGIRDEEETVLG